MYLYTHTNENGVKTLLKMIYIIVLMNHSKTNIFLRGVRLWTIICIIWVCVVLVLNVVRCSCHYFLDIIIFHHDIHHDSCDYHWDFMAINCPLIYTLGLFYISSSGSANAQLSGCFRPWTFSLNIGLNMLPLDSFISCLHSLLGYSTGEFQAFQLIVLD